MPSSRSGSCSSEHRSLMSLVQIASFVGILVVIVGPPVAVVILITPAIHNWLSRRSVSRSSERIAVLQARTLQAEQPQPFSDIGWSLYTAAYRGNVMVGTGIHIFASVALLFIHGCRYRLSEVISYPHPISAIVIWVSIACLCILCLANCYNIARSARQFQRLREIRRTRGGNMSGTQSTA
jgi:hypothetical protein